MGKDSAARIELGSSFHQMGTVNEKVQEITREMPIVFEGLKDVHPKLSTLFPQDTPPCLYALIYRAASIHKTFLSCVTVRVVSAQENLHGFDLSVFCS